MGTLARLPELREELRKTAQDKDWANEQKK
jgi:hypothetical protein